MILFYLLVQDVLLPLGNIETSFERGGPAHLFINVNVPGEVRSEVLDLCADVLLHHGDQRDPELFQLGLQRGQLGSLLPTRPEGGVRVRVTRVGAGDITNCFTVSVVEYRSLLYLSAQKSSRPPHRHDHGPVCLPQGACFDHHVFYEAETRWIIVKSGSYFFLRDAKKKSTAHLLYFVVQG